MQNPTKLKALVFLELRADPKVAGDVYLDDLLTELETPAPYTPSSSDPIMQKALEIQRSQVGSADSFVAKSFCGSSQERA